MILPLVLTICDIERIEGYSTRIDLIYATLIDGGNQDILSQKLLKKWDFV